MAEAAKRLETQDAPAPGTAPGKAPDKASDKAGDKSGAKAAQKPAGPAPKKRGKLLWIIVGAALLAGAGGAWFAFKSHDAPKAAGEAGVAAEKPSAPHAAPIYYKFDPAFVVNFGTEGNTRYLQITVEAMSRSEPVVDAIKTNEPAIRNDLVLLFSGQEYNSLVTPEGKERLRTATLEAIRKTVAAEGSDPKLVEAVYFTSFVIQ